MIRPTVLETDESRNAAEKANRNLSDIRLMIIDMVSKESVITYDLCVRCFLLHSRYFFRGWITSGMIKRIAAPDTIIVQRIME